MNHVVGCLLVGLRRRVKSVAGGVHIMHVGDFKSRSIIVNHVVGCLLVGLHRGVKSGAGGVHIIHAYGGGAISLIVVGRSHFWGTAARLKCVYAHWFGWSLAS